MTTTPPGVTVGGLLQSRPEALGLDPDPPAGTADVSRRITSPCVQKTGLALAGLHEYLRPDRVLMFGHDEVLRARGPHAVRKLADRLERQLQLAGDRKSVV